jgi:hypothetical protein
MARKAWPVSTDAAQNATTASPNVEATLSGSSWTSAVG